MSKNVSVKEGNIARKFRPVDRLNVITDNEQGMWKPESAFKLGTLHVSENGIYIASLNGYAAYSEIDVRVTDKLGSDDPDSYDYITPDPENYPDVWDPDSTDWDEADLNDPDEWELPEEFDETDLDTGDLEEPDFDPYDPEASLDDFDPSDLDTSNIKLEDPKLPKEKKLKGIDPDTGLKTEVTGIENEDGDMELSTEILPSAIHIVVPPRKRKYKEGDFIDYSGIHVYLLDDHHKLFTCAQYPTGEIPYGELIFPVSIAESSGSSGELNHLPSEIEAVATPPYSILNTSVIRVFERFDWVGVFATNVPVTACAFVKQNESNYVIIVVVASSSAFMYGTTAYKANIPDQEGTIPTPDHYVDSPYTINNKTVYHTTYGVDIDIENPNNSIPYVMCEDGNLISRKNDIIAWNMLYGDVTIGGGDSVPVQWMRSDGETLEDSFEITIGEEGGEEPQPPDPYNGYADIAWNGHYYNINRKKVPQIHYANGYIWQEGISTEYSVEQAASLGLIILMR